MKVERHSSNRPLRASSRTRRSLPGKFRPEADDVGVEDDSHVQEEATSDRYSSTRRATVLGAQALLPGPLISVPEQLSPLTFLDVAEAPPHGGTRSWSVPCCFMASSTRLAMSGGEGEGDCLWWSAACSPFVTESYPDSARWGRMCQAGGRFTSTSRSAWAAPSPQPRERTNSPSVTPAPGWR